MVKLLKFNHIFLCKIKIYHKTKLLNGVLKLEETIVTLFWIIGIMYLLLEMRETVRKDTIQGKDQTTL